MPALTTELGRRHELCYRLYEPAEAAVARRDWDAADAATRRLTETLESHLRAEELVLFPRFEEAAGAAGPVEVMLAEHEQMRGLLHDMQRACVARSASGWHAAGETLDVLMRQHDMKEEGVLYPMCDELLGAEAGDILARMAEIAGS